MKFTAILLTALATSILAQDCPTRNVKLDCKFVGKGADGLDQFADENCCTFPARCGNGDGGQVCELVSPKAQGKKNQNRRRRL
ncbi:uncharacterized protein LY79DRAFT_685679 [Colletotrichum navitas]|uniref:Uncharacterized protein n=1 Tax=Colletotrichum navitas TaxID=681940 RepID=A0AAD8UXS7_9PEZI|nr:uncharacterized protein LY79DRAFT_685679 [Colletotrichum navitas]KAK1561664.1 hypothetical protein LY79DRAFT_685679 [Colletotrichum navitas]